MIPETTHRLTDHERSQLMERLEEDGYCVLPRKLPLELNQACIAAIDRIAAARRQSVPATTGVKAMDCVELDPVFRRVMMFEPALQLSYDAFGPMFHLCQSNFVSRPRDETGAPDFVQSSPWHADGPRPAMFPTIGGAMGLHYLKFGYFFTDLTHGDGGPLQVVRGSHKRAELDGKAGSFSIDNYRDDVVTFNCEAGTVLAFHQAQWHAAPPNRSDIERKNAYISYCPTWMRPLDRELPRQGELTPDLTPEERWLLGEWRPPLRWWLPEPADLARMARFKRDATPALTATANYQ